MPFNLLNTWYLPSENTWKDFQVLAMKDIGTLSINNNGIIFNGTNSHIFIDQLISVSYGKQGRDFINNWVKIEYYDQNNIIQQAYFADGNNRGWSGIFGGTKRIYDYLLSAFSDI